MNVAVLGTGIVGKTLAEKIASLGHEVVVGTRDPDAQLARTEPDARGLEPFSAWLERNPSVQLMTYADAAGRGEIALNATSGAASLVALAAAGKDNLARKIIVDIANPLDFSKGMPPSLLVSNTDSLAEQIQRAFPSSKVVKALNTVTASVMVDPGSVAGGDHDTMICGDDEEAKAGVARILAEWFGWRSVVDVGDLTAARGLESYLLLWVRLMMAQGTAAFNVKIVR